MEKDYQIVSIGDVKFKVINLTEPVNENTEVYPGDPVIEKETVCTFEKNNCQYNSYKIGDHVFHPHGDAKKHHNPEYKNDGFEQWNEKYFFNEALLIDLSSSGEATELNGIKYHKVISRKDIEHYEDLIYQKSALVIRTGYDKYIEQNYKHVLDDIPYFDISAGEYISKFENINVVAIDSLTVDKPGTNKVHRVLKEKLIVESMVKLYKIPEEFINNFTLQTQPISIINSTGGPVVANAFLKETD